MRSLRSSLSAMSATEGCKTMSRSSLPRSSSVSLVLPLAAPVEQTAAAVSCSLRRAQSAIPALGHSQAADLAKLPKSFPKWVVSAGAGWEQDGDLDSCCSDCPSYYSSEADYFEVMDEPQRVSKDILRSLSTSFRWLEVPFRDHDLPRTDRESSAAAAAEPKSLSSLRKVDEWQIRPPVTNKDAWSHVYIHECRTGTNVLNHRELKAAMDFLGDWTILSPRNCCLSYRHGSTGEVVTLPWPDLEAGGPEEIEEFVRMVNSLEGRPVFFTRYGRFPYYAMNSVASLTKLGVSVLDSEK